MNRTIQRLVEAKALHHAVVAVIVLAGVVAGLETSPAFRQRHGPLLQAADRLSGASSWPTRC
jgi:hypothetical protein